MSSVCPMFRIFVLVSDEDVNAFSEQQEDENSKNKTLYQRKNFQAFCLHLHEVFVLKPTTSTYSALKPGTSGTSVRCLLAMISQLVHDFRRDFEHGHIIFNEPHL